MQCLSVLSNTTLWWNGTSHSTPGSLPFPFVCKVAVPERVSRCDTNTLYFCFHTEVFLYRALQNCSIFSAADNAQVGSVGFADTTQADSQVTQASSLQSKTYFPPHVLSLTCDRGDTLCTFLSQTVMGINKRVEAKRPARRTWATRFVFSFVHVT